ncbi:MAG: hypothetical protein ACRD0A_00245 [Acidimicrobiales bacterium]
MIHVATVSLAARPTAITSRTSPPSTTLSKIRWRWATIGERRSWAIGRKESVYWPKIG